MDQKKGAQGLCFLLCALTLSGGKSLIGRTMEFGENVADFAKGAIEKWVTSIDFRADTNLLKKSNKALKKAGLLTRIKSYRWGPFVRSGWFNCDDYCRSKGQIYYQTRNQYGNGIDQCWCFKNTEKDERRAKEEAAAARRRALPMP